MRFKIEGADRKTGEEGTLVVEAESVQAAKESANGAGLLVASVELVADASTQMSARKPDAAPTAVDKWKPAKIAGALAAIVAVVLFIVYLGQTKKPRPEAVTPQRPVVTVPQEAAYKGRKTSEWIAQLSDKESDTRREAVVALGHIGADAGPKAAEALEGTLSEPERLTRIVGCLALWDVANQAEAKVLIEIIQDRSQPVNLRFAALSTLLEITVKAHKLDESGSSKGLIAVGRIRIEATKLKEWELKQDKDAITSPDELRLNLAVIEYVAKVAF